MANENFQPKSILVKELLGVGATNGASLDDLWKNASLKEKRWCVKTAAQEIVREVAGRLEAEHGKERMLLLVDNPPFTKQVFRGKYKTLIGEPPSFARERERATSGLNDTAEILLRNRLLRRKVDPLMPRAQQVEDLLQLEGNAGFRISASRHGSNSTKSDTFAVSKKDLSTTIRDHLAPYPNTDIDEEYYDDVLDIVAAAFEDAFGPYQGPASYYAATDASTVASTTAAAADHDVHASATNKTSQMRKRTGGDHYWPPCKRQRCY